FVTAFQQNLALAGFALPHDGQRPKRAAPHSRQNLLPSGISALQLGQCTDRLPDLTRRAYHLSIVSGPLVRDRDQLWVEVRSGSISSYSPWAVRFRSAPESRQCPSRSALLKSANN